MIKSFQALREKVSKFVSDREWQQFHQPRNVLLALSGECGELCEIFQWRGPMSGLNEFSPAEVTHVGEEMADVFIYCTRLSDLCMLDLAAAVREQLSIGYSGTGQIISKSVTPNELWSDISFDDVLDVLRQPGKDFQLFNSTSPRDVAFCVQAELGKLCNTFSTKSESDCNIGLINWPRQDLSNIASSMASICILIIFMSYISNLSIGSCITDKIMKNEKKYPVELAKGNSAKYTAYQNKSMNGLKSLLNNPLWLTGAIFFIGLMVGVVISSSDSSIERKIINT